MDDKAENDTVLDFRYMDGGRIVDPVADARRQANAIGQYALLGRAGKAPDTSWREQALREKAVELAIRMNAIDPENMIATAERIYAFLCGSESGSVR